MADDSRTTAGAPKGLLEDVEPKDMQQIDLFRPTYGNVQLTDRFRRAKRESLPQGSLNKDGVTGMQHRDNVLDAKGQLIHLADIELGVAWKTLPRFELTWTNIIHHAQQLDFDSVADAQWYRIKHIEHVAELADLQEQLTAAVQRRLNITLPMPEQDRIRTVTYLRALFSKIRRRFEQEMDKHRGRRMKFTTVPHQTYIGDQMLYLYVVLREAYATIRPIPEHQKQLFHLVFLSTVLSWQREILGQVVRALDNDEQETAPSMDEPDLEFDTQKDASGTSGRSSGDNNATKRRRPGRPAGSKNKSEQNTSNGGQILEQGKAFGATIAKDTGSHVEGLPREAGYNSRSANSLQWPAHQVLDGAKRAAMMHASMLTGQTARSPYPEISSDTQEQQRVSSGAHFGTGQRNLQYASNNLPSRASKGHAADLQWTFGQPLDGNMVAWDNLGNLWESVPEDWPAYDRQMMDRLNRQM